MQKNNKKIKKGFLKYVLYAALLFLVIIPAYLLADKFFRLKEEKEAKKEEERQTISIVATGDIMLGRHVGKLIAEGMDPFEFLRFDEAHPNSFQKQTGEVVDIAMGNLEGPITTAQTCQVKAYSFKFATSTAELLRDRGMTAVSLANNHSLDCFEKGFRDTQKYLSETGVTYFGGFKSKDIVTESVIDGVAIAFVGLDMTIVPAPTDALYAQIKALKPRNTFIIVNIHWGDEYAPEPNSAQKKVAHRLIDSGVDVVFGGHPHVVEPVETYKGKTIFYSLGNFIFDQTAPETKKAMLGYVTLFPDGTQTYKMFPVRIEKTQPKLNGVEK